MNSNTKTSERDVDIEPTAVWELPQCGGVLIDQSIPIPTHPLRFKKRETITKHKY
jgi:hypothetical protein